MAILVSSVKAKFHPILSLLTKVPHTYIQMCLVYVGGLLWGTRTRQPTNPTIIWILIPGKREERFLPNIFFFNHFLTPTFDCELARSLNWWYFYLNFLFSKKNLDLLTYFFFSSFDHSVTVDCTAEHQLWGKITSETIPFQRLHRIRK